jgi:hypothetical protein
MSNEALFSIQNVDLDNGQVEVRFINKYGPIYTKQKTIQDFMVEVEVPGENIDKNGQQIPKKEKVLTTQNPNDDLIYSIDIPIDENNNYVSEDELIRRISLLYPNDQFEAYLKKKTVVKNNQLKTLIGKNYEVTISPSENESLGMENYSNNFVVHII